MGSCYAKPLAADANLNLQVDVDDNAEASEAYYIKSMPTFVFFKNGQEVGRMSGADESQLRTWVRRLRLAGTQFTCFTPLCEGSVLRLY